MNIEQTIKTDSLPVNSKAMIARLGELMEEHGGNCLTDMKEDARVQGVLWLLNSQVFGQSATINMMEVWDKLQDEL